MRKEIRIIGFIIITILFSQCKQPIVEIGSGKDSNGLREYNELLKTDFLTGNIVEYEDGHVWKEYEKLLEQRNLFSQRTVSNSPIVWTERGPFNIPGRIRSVAIDPNDTDTWYVGSVGGGVWKTEDLGSTWTNLTDFKTPNIATSYVVLSENNSSTLYVGTGEPYGNVDAIGGIGIIKSIDAGNNWTVLNNTSGFGDIARLAIDPNNENIVVAAAQNGIYRTTNGGDSWVPTQFQGFDDLKAAPSNFNTMYAASENGQVFRSSNGGSNWSNTGNIDIPSGTSISRIEVAVSEQNENKVYLSVYYSNQSEAVFLSTNGGTNWSELTENNSVGNDFLGAQGWYDNVVKVHPFDDNIIYVGGVRSFKMNINPTTGTRTSIRFPDVFTGGPVHVDQHVIEFIKGAGGNFRLILGSDGGVAMSSMDTDPGVSTGDFVLPSVNGMNSTQFYGADKAPGQLRFIAGAQDNNSLVSADGVNASSTTNYSAVRGGDGFECIWKVDDVNRLMVTSQFNGIAVSNNGGASSFFVAPSNASGSNVAPFYSRLSTNDLVPDRVFTFSAGDSNPPTGSPVIPGGVWRTNDFGSNWSLAGISFDSNVRAGDISVSLADPDVVWVSNVFGGGAFGDNLWVSTNGGDTFSRNTGNPNLSFAAVPTSIETHPTDANTAYVTFRLTGNAKIIRTTDLGNTWTELSGFGSNNTSSNGFPDVGTYCLLVFPFDTDKMWAGTDVGIVETTDGGQTWELLDDAFPNVAVYQMQIVDGIVVIATHGRGVWTAEIDELLNTSEVNTNKDSFNVYPNPTIDFIKVKSNELVIGNKYTVYDMAGKLQLNGIYSNEGIDVRNLSSGVYIVKVNVGDTVKHQKFIKK